ncbi:MAG: VWA domain-containing protein [Planctomycetes bacterium]|nr:VWA domain-containing protein [Planctomycetota bacterium]
MRGSSTRLARRPGSWLASSLLAVLAAAPLAAQVAAPEYSSFASNVIVPQRRSIAWRPGASVQITEVSADIAILEQTSATTLTISLRNPSRQRLEAELLVPVPDGAAACGFTFQGAGKEPTARLLPREEARRIYDAIVARIRDPALLEFAGYNLIRSSVFPVEPGGTQKVRLTYENLLPADGQRVDYVLPRSEALDYTVAWKISAEIRSKRAISTVYSPSHDIDTTRTAPGHLKVSIRPEAARNPGAFRLSYLFEDKDVSASFLAYPDPRVGGGYFLLLAGLPASDEKDAERQTIQREIILVLDRSGSMSGEKIEQVREAALQIIAGLEDGEAFNIIPYSDTVEAFRPKPVVKTPETEREAREYLKGIRARGGTNIHDALLEALRQEATPGRLPIVLFLTDGLPTIGQTSEIAIREVAMKSNPDARRIFTFGVGVDVNTPLLERIASVTRATATFVLPREDVEVKVGRVFRRLSGPVLAAPQLAVLDAEGRPAAGKIRDLAPSLLPDLFEGDQLVVLGQYLAEGTLRFSLQGNYLGQERTFTFSFDSSSATTRNAFVPRLWASRKIAYLEDAIRDLGAAHGLNITPHQVTDPRLRELVDEIVRLSTEFGILSEYTAFLAEEGTDITDHGGNLTLAGGNFVRRSLRDRSGVGSVNQDLNRMAQKGQSALNFRNYFYNADMDRVSVTTVQQLADKTFYNRRGRWIDSQVASMEKEVEPRRVVEFASEEFRELLGRLVAQGRQSCVSLPGDILMVVDGEAILVKGPTGETDAAPAREALQIEKRSEVQEQSPYSPPRSSSSSSPYNR